MQELTVLSAKHPYALVFNNINVKISDHTPKPSKKKEKVHVVIYPEFKNMIPLINDEYWIEILKTYSYGKFQKDVKFKHNTISYKKFSQEIDFENLENGLNNLLNFLKTKVGIYSPTDMEIKNELFIEEINKTNVSIDSWSQVKKKSHKTLLISKYIQSFKDTLTSSQLKDLENKINLGILAEYFNSSNIIIKNGFIEKIEGLIQDEDGNFHIDFDTIKIKKTKSKKNVDENDYTIFSSTLKDITGKFDKSKTNIDSESFKQLKKILLQKEKKNDRQR